ncbi:MAG: DUF1844 domain-containing protein [candidate division NC10 bacterium]|nr:DUF1844 domain-containing protein [candidate division NC10 bacterium]MBI4841202.1 DUF1844 domain-containing protein [candidate division NC10 bacterium]
MNLDQAKQVLDLLDDLKNKTAGNLTAAEARIGTPDDLSIGDG